MGSKTKIIDYVVNGINEVRRPSATVLDLFAGSCSLAGAIGRQAAIHSNDIQSYSAVLADAYTNSWKSENSPEADQLLSAAEKEVDKTIRDLGDYLVKYDRDLTLPEFVALEEKQRELIDIDFGSEWHLFLKNYSGTWWSAEQCLWIDAFRKVADDYKEDPTFSVIMSSLMFAMAYSSQGTGHYAQYRDANTHSSMKDIMIYRMRDVRALFIRKYSEVISTLPKSAPNTLSSATSLNYSDALKSFAGGTVYADPPYCFVHYSRFYHALETLVKYDYPEIQIKGGKIVKGRYRVDRHQSPFCISSKVPKAFEDMFRGVQETNSNLVLSYSNTGMISLEHLSDIAAEIFHGRKMELLSMDYQHMTLGRQGIRHRDVKECLLLVK